MCDFHTEKAPCGMSIYVQNVYGLPFLLTHMWDLIREEGLHISTIVYLLVESIGAVKLLSEKQHEIAPLDDHGCRTDSY